MLILAPSVAVADVRGRVVDDATQAPIAGATVYGTDPDAAVITDDDGRFTLVGDVPAVTVVADDHDPVVALAGAGEVLVAMAATGTGGEVIEIAGGRITASPGAATVERTEITRLPGARGDVLAGIKNLPGVANNGSLTPLTAGLIIRGASPEDSRVLVDGFEIPVLYHFLGVQSVLPSEMIEDVEYQPGTFGVSQGKASGGLVSVSSRADATAPGGFAELSFINVAGLVQGPIGTRGSYAIAARRSVIDALLPAVIPADAGLDFTAYPRYYDYQARIAYRPATRWALSGFAFGSDDKVQLLSDGDNAADPVASGEFANATSFTRVIGTATYRRGALTSATGVSAYTDRNHFTVGADRFLNLDRASVAARSELTWDPSTRLRLSAGAEADLTRTAFAMKFTRPPREGDPRGPNFSEDALLETRGTTTSPDLATWMSTTWAPVRALELTGGARIDAFARNEVVVAQPRGQAVWHVADGSTLRAAAGVYTRPPENLDENLQDDLDPERAIQTAFGGERQLAPGLTASGTIFYNRLSDLLVLPADRRDPMSLGGYVNQGTGESYGIELLLKVRSERAFGWLAYTGARARRRDAPDQPTRRFDYDQAHNLIAVGSWKLGRNWQVGGRFQLTTGKPYTPVVGAIYQADIDLYVPSYGPLNSARVATQHQLDLRIDRTWRFRSWSLSAYLDVSNVYVNAAAIDYAYNFDYTARTAITSLPILPALGVRGEL
ncbi:MAG: TonB-dependent receptor [Deltaproteobacteria bacterium]|nr:TonB-dependent receptor [Deltaproteobacteria bacterium]